MDTSYLKIFSSWDILSDLREKNTHQKSTLKSLDQRDSKNISITYIFSSDLSTFDYKLPVLDAELHDSASQLRDSIYQ